MSETQTNLISAAVEYYFYDQRPRKMRKTESSSNTIIENEQCNCSSLTETGDEKVFMNLTLTTSTTDNSRHDDSVRKFKRIDRKASLEFTTSCSSDKESTKDGDHDNDNDNDNDDQHHQHNDDASTSKSSSDLTLKLTVPETKQQVPVIERTPPSTLEPGQCASDMSPDTYLHQLFMEIMSFQPRVRPTLEVSSVCCENSDRPFIPPITEEEQANYDSNVVSAVREGDIQAVQSIHSNGVSLSCCNRFGESLLHMACRRGYESIVLFLVEEADVSVRITDDCGRTPLHDALWHRDCQYAIMDLLVRTDPILLLTCDKRGHTPFAYARREHWANWRQFLWDRREHMRRAFNAAEVPLFCKK